MIKVSFKSKPIYLATNNELNVPNLLEVIYMPSFVHNVRHILSNSDKFKKRKGNYSFYFFLGNKKLKFNLMVDPQNVDLLYLAEFEKHLHLSITC